MSKLKQTAPARRGFVDALVGFALRQKLVVLLGALLLTGVGVLVAPFDWDLRGLPRSPVPVDAIPDIGENQQIVFTRWPGRSPQDVQDQITYPLTTLLLGVPGVRTVRSSSMFGFSSIYVIFNDDVDFYWSRSRLTEKLNSLAPGSLPAGVRPTLGPDATALGQVYWYTLEGRDPQGRPAGGWDLQELRGLQDWYVRYGLLAAQGVAEVASVGGFVKEYQIDLDPDAMRVHRVTLPEVARAVRRSNRDVGARTIEINRVEYVVRGVGLIKSVADLEQAVIRAREGAPITIKDVARVTLGPAPRRGGLDKGGTEAVGGVVVARFGTNPLAVIGSVKEKIRNLSKGLPSKTLVDGTVSKVTIVPFYDRSGLIRETLATLDTALRHEILITIVVVLIMLVHLRSSILISSLLPAAVLMTFIAMKGFGVDANVVALSGIAIAIGTMVDMSIVMTENILRHLERAPREESRLAVVQRAASEVGGAVITSVATTVVSFLPVFTMEAAEGKLFRPLAFTKTFALLASLVLAIVVLPPLAQLLFTAKVRSTLWRRGLGLGVIAVGIGVAVLFVWWAGLLVVAVGAYHAGREWIPPRLHPWAVRAANGVAAAVVAGVLAKHWLPLGPEAGVSRNLALVALMVGSLLGAFWILRRFYSRILRWCLDHKVAFLSLPGFIVLLGALSWLGYDRVLGWLPAPARELKPVAWAAAKFPGLGKEFMPTLDEGSFLLMPTTMPHASMGEAMDILSKQDRAIAAIPEVAMAVGKIGRADSPLDPAPISMVETIINIKSRYLIDAKGHPRTFRFVAGDFDLFRDPQGRPVDAPDGKPFKVRGYYPRKNGRLIPDSDGSPFRLWRPPLHPKLNPGRKPWAGIRKPDDIWREIARAAKVPGVTGAPKLQPIAARIAMLQTGMRAPMGVKIRGPDLRTIEQVGMQIERLLKEVRTINPATVNADRIVGKPYLEVHIDRQAIARHGIGLGDVQDVLELAVGGQRVTTTVEGIARYGVRLRYQRERRNSVEALGAVLVPVPGPGSVRLPLRQLAEIRYVRGPQMIKSEDAFLVGFVTFDKVGGVAEVDVVDQARAYLKMQIAKGRLKIPAGVSYAFSGTYENQVRSEKRLLIILPVALVLIVILLQLHFRSIWTTGLVFTGIAVAWAGGFLMLWLYGQPWFLDFALFGTNMRDLFGVHTINLSVAVWVGFLALFGIATDDGVVMATYLRDRFAADRPGTVEEIRQAVVIAGQRRVRACLMTTATTLLALLPVLTSTGRGSDIMVPMAIPTFGGMLVATITMFVVPVLYSAVREFQLKLGASC
jgi:copper/silver efflux system protein